jgi:hypothetical protein
MTPTEMRGPDAELRLPDGTDLTLYRNVTVTMDDKTKITGEWMIVLEKGQPRAVVFFFERDGKRRVEMVYDKHTLKHGENSVVPAPEKLDYVLTNIYDKAEEEKYLRMRQTFEGAEK